MRVGKIYCVGNDCRLFGATEVRMKVDYVFAYAPMHVRYSPGTLTVDFGSEVECEKFYNEERGINYLLCAPVVKDHDLVEDEFGLPAVIDLEV